MERNRLDKKKIKNNIIRKGILLPNIQEYLMEYDKDGNKFLDEEYIKKEKIAIIDCDGILTNGKSYYTADGKFIKGYGAYDKEMLKLLLRNYNWKFFFVTDDALGYQITNKRVQDFIGYENNVFFERKTPEGRYYLIKKLKNENNLIVFIGDSLSDVSSLLTADIGATVKNAPKLVKSYSDLVSSKEGGNGGLADILFYIHTHNGKI